MSSQLIDLRSDTVTHPTAQMRKAMYEAEVGDDVLQEDPTVNALEEYAAGLLGKEAALFVPSGTFGNQLALFTHCERGNEVILPEQSHIVQNEGGAAAIIAGVQLRTIFPRLGYPIWTEIEGQIRKEEDIHYPETGLVEIENALSNGDVMPLEAMAEIARHLKALDLPVHLDGARIFNAAASLGVEAKEIAGFADSVMFCLSKGLCAPVGSIITGERDFIKKARKGRKIMGGGMRQAGILAAAGLFALKEMIYRLAEDNQKAKRLAAAFQKTGIFEIQPQPVKINMVFIRFKTGAYSGLEGCLVSALKKHSILIYPPENGWIRFVAHHDVSFEDIERMCQLLEGVIDEVMDQKPER